MLKKFLAGLRPTPSMAVSIVAVVIALGSAGFAATGGTFILGAKNLAETTTTLKTRISGTGLVVQNTKGPALALVGVGNKPPLSVNSATKVKNLNADYLDDLDSSAFLRAGVPLDATTLGGRAAANVPSIVRVPFTLAPGANSAAIPLPVGDPAVMLGSVTTPLSDSIGEVSLVPIQGPVSSFIDWAGLEPFSTGNAQPTITGGFSNTAGHHIVFIDFNHLVDVQVNNATSIRIHNGASGQMTGVVTLTY